METADFRKAILYMLFTIEKIVGEEERKKNVKREYKVPRV